MHQDVNEAGVIPSTERVLTLHYTQGDTLIRLEVKRGNRQTLSMWVNASDLQNALDDVANNTRRV